MIRVDYDAVAMLIRSVGDDLLMRHWRALSASAVREKSKGDFVTDVDEEAERQLHSGLQHILPAAVLGEEAAAADPALLNLPHEDDALWVIDPIDGTANYIDGTPYFAIMVALVVAGKTQASWIYQPVPRKLFHARAGGGAQCNGSALLVLPETRALSALHVGISVKFTPEPLRSHVEKQLHHFASHAPFMCAGFEYAALASGEKAMALFHRLYPWDHLPGLLLMQEAGLVTRHLDGTPYDMRAERKGLMIACDATVWQLCRDLLIPESLRD